MKKTLIVILIISATVVVVSQVSAYKLLCLGYGESINPEDGDLWYTCWHDLCQICVTDNDYPANPNRCRYMTGCGSSGNSTIDSEPPNLTINSPVNYFVYDSRKVLFDLESNEPASFYWIDNVNGRGRWKRLSSNAYSYYRELSQDEGLNDITIKAKDRHGNFVEVQKEFYVDSKDPKIKRTYPKNGFASGFFEVEFQEENPDILYLHYGNLIRGYQQSQLNIGDCDEDRGKYYCSDNVDLSLYDGQEIEYWFELFDIADNSDESSYVNLDVDSSAPIINNIDYWVDGKYVHFIIDVTESYLDEITYIDNSDSRAKETRLCSKLVNGICEKRVSFSDGGHDITIYILDKAGNKVAQSRSFFTDSKEPKIKNTHPTRGFADGNFEVEFNEENPVSLVLNYGNYGTGYRTEALNIASECSNGHGEDYSCDVSVDLGDYDEQDIEYWFELEDIVGQTDESKTEDLSVDISPPIINNIDFEIDGRRVEFVFDITEKNFEEISYYDNSDSRPRWRKLCSKLNNGICETRKSFSSGYHDLDIQVTDEAGNAVGERIEFEIN